VIGLLAFWGRGQNPVWGGATIAFILGLITAAIYYFSGAGFHWSIVGKWVVVAVDLALLQELIRALIKRGQGR
jgi:hypothetical protein